MKNSRPILVALILLTLACRAEEFNGDVTDVSIVRRVEQQSGAALLWEPYLALGRPGQVIVAFGAGIAGKTDMGDILCCTSDDDGKSWAEPVAVFDHANGTEAYANPVLYKPLGQETIWCFAMHCPMTVKNSENSHLAAAKTSDGGKSWQPVALAIKYDGPLIIVAGILRTERNGVPSYLLPAHTNTKASDPAGSREQLLLASENLTDWRKLGTVPQPTQGPIVFLHEASIAFGDSTAELKMMMRTADYEKAHDALTPPRAFSSISRDGGQTWLPAAAEPELWNSVAKAYFARSETGEHLYVYNDGPARSRMALRYKVQSGKTWSGERTFFDSGTHNSYPTLVESSPGEFYGAWDSGTAENRRTMIRFGKLTLK